MLSEISRSQRGRYYMIHLYEAATVVRFIETESRMLVARGWGTGRWRVYRVNMYRVLVLQDEKVLEMDSGDACKERRSGMISWCQDRPPFLKL